MKNSIFFPALFLLLVANLLVFCTKEPVQNQTFTAIDGQVQDRESCTYKIKASPFPVRVCGTLSNSEQCYSCAGNPLMGVETVSVQYSGIVPVGPGQKLSICNGDNGQTQVKILVSGNSQPVTFTLGPNQKRDVKIDENCSVILGESCEVENCFVN